MRVIENDIIPFPGFKAINICGVLFKRRGTLPMTENQMRHEEIHTAQIRELWYVGFYVWYVVEWMVRFVVSFNAMKAYRAISFEQEAYSRQAERDYLEERKAFAWWKYV